MKSHLVKKWDGILNEDPPENNKTPSPERPMFLACRSTDNLSAYEEDDRKMRNSPVRTYIDLKDLALKKDKSERSSSPAFGKESDGDVSAGHIAPTELSIMKSSKYQEYCLQSPPKALTARSPGCSSQIRLKRDHSDRSLGKKPSAPPRPSTARLTSASKIPRISRPPGGLTKSLQRSQSTKIPLV